MIRMKSAAAAIAFAAASGSSGHAQAPASHPWQTDLRFVVDTLKQVHPAPFTRITEARFDDMTREVEAALPALGPREAALRIGTLVSRLGDGHTTLGLGSPVFASDTSFPVRVERFSDGLYVTAVRPEDRALLGARIAGINGLPEATFWERLATIASGDNVWSRMADLPLRLIRPEVIAGLGLGGADALELELHGAAGDLTTRARIPAVPVPFSTEWYGDSFEGPAGATVSLPSAGAPARDVSYRHPGRPYWFTRDGDLLFVRLNQLVDGDGPVQLGDREAAATLDQFWQAVLAAADRDPAPRLVIDLRNNRGGNNAFARAFVDTIAARPALNRKGRLFVITGRRTFSAAMNFVSQMEDRTAALFVGEPAGGSPSHYGDAQAFTLPQSGLTVFVSTIPWTTGVSPRDVREEMQPDLPAPVTFAAFRDGRDPALDAIRRYTDGDVLSDHLLAVYKSAGMDAAIAAYGRRRGEAGLRGPWAADVQQLLEFGNALIAARAEGRDIFRAFTFATELHPDSVEAWADQARVLAFIRQWRGAEKAYARALELRPAQPLLRRFYQVARRR